MEGRLIFLHYRFGEEASRDGEGQASRESEYSAQASRGHLYDQKANELSPRRDEAPKLRLRRNLLIPCFQEKLRVESRRYPYRKPTLVGGWRTPRRLRELWLRNSANCHRNFGIRWA